MTKPNTKFELSVKDIRLIEEALREKMNSDGTDPEIKQTEKKQITELLGKIHNQKNWYRKSNGVYVSG